MQKLKKDGVKFEVLLSNHSIEFILAYEKMIKMRETTPKEVKVKSSPFCEDYRIESSQTVSMKRLGRLIEHDLVTEESIITLTTEDYLPSLKLLSYSINDERTEITIYSHAIIGLALISRLAAKLGTQYVDTSIFDLAKTIEDINLTFQTYAKAGTINTLNLGPAVSLDLTTNPVAFLAWNRELVADRPKEHNGYCLSFVHGHDPEDITNGHIVNLDNALGKTNFALRFNGFCNSGEYSVLYSWNSHCELQATATELAAAPQHSTSPDRQRFFQKPEPETATPSTSNPSLQPGS